MAYTWKPIYRELATKLLEYETRQGELIGALKDLAREGHVVISLEDKFPDGTSGDLREIDPFTFFSSFNRGITDGKRIAIIGALKKRFGLTSPLPEDFDGIPIMDNRSSWFIRYSKTRRPDDVPARWRLARAIIAAKAVDDIHPELIDECLSPTKGNLTSITMGMFWLSPDLFPALDWKNQDYADKNGVRFDDARLSGDTYLAWVMAVRAKFGGDLARFSYEAHKQATDDDDEEELPLGENKPTPIEDAAGKPIRVWSIAAEKDGSLWPMFEKAGCAAIGWDEIGDVSALPSKPAIEAALQKHWPSKRGKRNDRSALWKFSRSITAGDIVVAKSGLDTAYGIGVVTGDYVHDLAQPNYRNRRSVKWIATGKKITDGVRFTIKTLTEITHKAELIRWLESVYGVDLAKERAAVLSAPEPVPPPAVAEAPAVELEPYSKIQAADELFMDAARIDHLLALSERKKNIILQGPPGVGKTFAAKRLAWAAMGAKDNSRVCTVQFHQSYSYEDFVQGIRPDVDKGGFVLKDGVFYQFARRAIADPKRAYYFIIDEINRGQLARIFGELMMLIEADKRGPEHAIPLMYATAASQTFYLPANLHFIATMNTADRSLSLVDYALRRRFAFVTIGPAFEAPGFAKELAKHDRPAALVEKIKARMLALNKAIAEDTRNLGEGYQIGHSYFCTAGAKHDEWYADVIRFEIQPLLEEYWGDQPKRLADALAELSRP